MGQVSLELKGLSTEACSSFSSVQPLRARGTAIRGGYKVGLSDSGVEFCLACLDFVLFALVSYQTAPALD